jgi:glycosidase
MDFTLHDAMTVMFNEDIQGWDKGIYRAYDNFTNDFLYENSNNLLVFAGNHDTNRINEIYKGNLSKYKLAMTLILTIRGMPQLYYGDEIGMRGNKVLKGDGDIRRDFPGGWFDDSQNAFKDSNRTSRQKAYFDFTRKLLQWRKHKSVVHSGQMIHFVPKNNLYVYFRVNKTDKVMVIINNAPKKSRVNPNDYQEVLMQNKSGFDIISEKNIDLSKSFELAPKSSMIIEVKN